MANCISIRPDRKFLSNSKITSSKDDSIGKDTPAPTVTKMTKKFDKKNVLRFRLVQRSVTDVRGTGDASERIFEPLNKEAAKHIVRIL